MPLFGDLKRHHISDSEISQLGNELLAQRFVERDVFITAELWGVGSTAPYGHRNDITTLDEVIRAHGGEGRDARQKLHRRQRRRPFGAHRLPEDSGDPAMTRSLFAAAALVAGLCACYRRPCRRHDEARAERRSGHA